VLPTYLLLSSLVPRPPCHVQVIKLAGILGEEKVEVHARGELQLGLLIEGMRRDSFEMEISAPQVLMKQEAGRLLEPLEEVWLDIPQFAVGGSQSQLFAPSLIFVASAWSNMVLLAQLTAAIACHVCCESG
jgi:hypothetical protein